MKKQKHKILLLSICAILLVIGTVFGTIAYFTDSEAVTNTFSVGKVEISMDEAAVDEYGAEIKGADRRIENTYKLIPGNEYTKDPVIYVTADSEECWLFVKVENGIEAYETKDTTKTIDGQLRANGWELLKDNIYYKKAADTDEQQNVATFVSFTIDGEANDVEGWDEIDPQETKIVVTAYAVQEAGFNTAEAAWNATFGK